MTTTGQNLNKTYLEKSLTCIKEENYEFITSEPFVKYISSGTTDKTSVVGRITDYKNFISSILNR